MSKYAAKKSKLTELGERVSKAIVAKQNAEATKPVAGPRRDWALKRLTVLDARLGENVGAARERERLYKLVHAK
jgi:hypothetical protein